MTVSCPSSLIHSGMGVPQNRERLIAQSCAFCGPLFGLL